VDAEDENGETALYWAGLQGAVDLLKKHGARKGTKK